MLEDKPTHEIAAYLRKWDGHLNRYFRPRTNVDGKRVLVIGSQFGTEVLWALRNGASEVIGLDPSGCSPAPLIHALGDLGLDDRRDDFRLLQHTTHDAPDLGAFDYVISNNVFEHIHDLAATLASLARFVPNRENRIVIFADPLFYSSAGHHLRAGPWEHLTLSQTELEKKVPPRQWKAFREQLNGMTLTDFLCAVRDAGLLLLDLEIVPDRAIAEYGELARAISPAVRPMDACLEGLACTLAFPRNI